MSICEWGIHKPWTWGAKMGGHMWRTTGDITTPGMYGKGNVAHGGCSDAEYRSRYSLLNREVIAVNQDLLGRQGYHMGEIDQGGEIGAVWAKPLEDGSVAVGLFNLGERERRLMVVGWESVGLHDQRR